MDREPNEDSLNNAIMPANKLQAFADSCSSRAAADQNTDDMLDQVTKLLDRHEQREIEWSNAFEDTSSIQQQLLEQRSLIERIFREHSDQNAQLNTKLAQWIESWESRYQHFIQTQTKTQAEIESKLLQLYSAWVSDQLQSGKAHENILQQISQHFARTEQILDGHRQKQAEFETSLLDLLLDSEPREPGSSAVPDELAERLIKQSQSVEELILSSETRHTAFEAALLKQIAQLANNAKQDNPARSIEESGLLTTVLQKISEMELRDQQFAEAQHDLRQNLHDLQSHWHQLENSLGPRGRENNDAQVLCDRMTELQQQLASLQDQSNQIAENIKFNCDLLAEFGEMANRTPVKNLEGHDCSAIVEQTERLADAESRLRSLIDGFADQSHKTSSYEHQLLEIVQQVLTSQLESAGSLQALREQIEGIQVPSPVTSLSHESASHADGHTEDESSWQKQKEFLLAQLSSLRSDSDETDPPPESKLSLASSDTNGPVTPKASCYSTYPEVNPNAERAKETEYGAENHQDIERLKAELEAKLRKAEIDISIERAKIARIQSELVVKEADLNRRLQKIEQTDQDTKAGKTQILSRLSRWLPNKSRS
ncbi:MAG TPA: hypothetical protein PKD64_07545 [Pirellulaceae bacterium]|nr:hypothetical protein [Pirellulaceae bacterium]HMP68839.1 hypothetical protein [Pirellulaceae bacterium]